MHLHCVVALLCKIKFWLEQLNQLLKVPECLLVIGSVSSARTFLLPADSTDGVRLGLQGHAQFGSDSGDGSWRELQMKPLQQSGEEEEHLHPGQLFTQTATLP